jgi:environmental stress-induced protein Ves
VNADGTDARAAPAQGLRVVRAADAAARPWKNGGGTTRELLRLPDAGADDDGWALRISVADVGADGPFSPFPGVARWFAVIGGAGVRLAWTGANGARRVDLGPADGALRFDGGDPPDCRLLDGPTQDLNVMARDGAATAEVASAAFDQPCAWTGGLRGVFTLRALALHRGAASLTLPAHALAWSDGVDESTWRLSPSPDAPADGATPPALWIAAALRSAP